VTCYWHLAGVLGPLCSVCVGSWGGGVGGGGGAVISGCHPPCPLGEGCCYLPSCVRVLIMVHVASLVMAMEPLLWVGSEDAIVRLWDLRSHKSVRCLTKVFDGAPVTSIAWVAGLPGAAGAGSGTEHSLLVAAGSSVHHFDLRRPEVVLSTSNTTFTFSSDEINQVAVHHGSVPDVLSSGRGSDL
jgi:WD40 repeat protein